MTSEQLSTIPLTNNELYAIEYSNRVVRLPYTTGCDAYTARILIAGYMARARIFPHNNTLIVYKLSKNKVYRHANISDMLPTLPHGYIIIDLRKDTVEQ